MFRPPPSWSPAILALLPLLPACVAGQSPGETPLVQQLQASQRLELLLSRVRAERPLAGGADDLALADSRVLVRLLTAAQLEQLIAQGNAAALTLETFRPGGGRSETVKALVAWLQDSAQPPGDSRARLLTALQRPLPPGQSETLDVTRDGDRLSVTVRRWQQPSVSLASALRASSGRPSPQLRRLLEDAMVLVSDPRAARSGR